MGSWRIFRAATILAVIPAVAGGPAAGADAPCIGPMPQDILDRLVLGAPSGIQPGGRAWFTLGTWECCVFQVPYPACAVWTLEPAGAGTVTITQDGTLSQGPGVTGYVEAGPEVPAGTVLTLRADIESGRAARSAEIHVYTPESNPLVGHWIEEAQITCGGFLRGDSESLGFVDLSSTIVILQWLFLGMHDPHCPLAADANGDDRIDISDPVYLMMYLFLGGPAPGLLPECEPITLATYPRCTSENNHCPMEDASPAEPIYELLFEADGTFSVTWLPFEVYRDYWGSYAFDLANKWTISLRVEGGNYIPPDLPNGPEGPVMGKWSIFEGNLYLRGLWLGSPRDIPMEPRCGHRFRRP